MIKQIMIGLLTLVVIIASLIGFQWILFDKGIQQSEKIQDTNLEIDAELIHKKGQLLVTQNVSNLMQDTYWIHLPQGVLTVKCNLPNGEKCNVNNDHSNKQIHVANHNNVTLTYILPVDEGKKYGWFEDAFVGFLTDDQVEIPANFKVTLTEEVDKAITWVSGANSEAKVEKEHLSYFAWTKQDAAQFPLYLSKTPLIKSESIAPHMVVYQSKQQRDPIIDNGDKWYEIITPYTDLTLVRSDAEGVILSPLLVVAPKGIDNERMKELVIHAYLLYYKKPNDESVSWVWNVLPSFVLNRPVGHGKEKEMSKDLLANLQPNIRSNFTDWLLSMDSEETIITLNDLDQKLSEIANMKTTFFADNANQNDEIVPLYFIDGRKVYYNELQINVDWNVVVRNNTIHFPFEKTVGNLDFKVVFFPETQSYLLTKPGFNVRFYLDQAIFIYNQESYGLTNKPLQQFNGDVYISEKLLEELLKVEVIKREDGIYLR